MLSKGKKRRELVAAARQRRWHRRAETGQAMLIVVALIALISTVPIVVLSTATSQVFLSTQNLNWNAAYEAAEAGLNDYTQHLDAASLFAQYVTTDKGFTNCNYATTPPTDVANDAAFCGWVQVAKNSQTSPPEWYEYGLPSLSGGALTLTVTGKAGVGDQAVYRTFTFNVVPESSFLDNIYWSNYEMLDPTLTPACAAALGVLPNTSPSAYVNYASDFASSGPPAIWTQTAAVNANTTNLTVTSNAGLIVGEGISDTGGVAAGNPPSPAIPAGTTIASLPNSTTIVLSTNTTKHVAADSINVALGSIPPYSQQPWPPPAAQALCWIWFATGDVVDGPLFTNDTLRVLGTPTFTGSVYSAAAGRVDAPVDESGTGLAEPPCVTSGAVPYVECATPPARRGDEPKPTTGADVTPAQNLGCYITGGTNLAPNSSPAQVTLSLTAQGGTTKVTWVGTGPGWTWVDNNDPPNTNACGNSGAVGSNGGSFLVSSLSAGIIYVNGDVTIQQGSTVQGFLTIVAGDQSNAGPVEWSTISGTVQNTKKTVTVASTAGIAVGDSVNDSDNLIPNNTTVSSIVGTTVTLNNAATGSLNADALSFTSQTTGNVSNNSTSVPGLPANAPVAVGDLIADGDGYILPMTTVTAYNSATKTLTLSQPAVIPGGSGNGDTLYLSSENTGTSAGDIAIDGSVTYSGNVTTTAINCPAGGGSIPAWSPCPSFDQNDALGLISDYFIQFPPAQASADCPAAPVTIDAALLALNDSAYVAPDFSPTPGDPTSQGGWTQDGQCALRLFGSLGQDFRGPVGLVGQAGFVKQYVYDGSLRVLWPPYYLSASSATWGPSNYAEGVPGYANRVLANAAYATGCGTAC